MSIDHQIAQGSDSDSRIKATFQADEAVYRRLFEAAQEGMLILDGDTGRISDVNPYLFELLGFSRNAMVGKTLGELSPFQGIESIDFLLEQLLKDGYVQREELSLETQDGRKMVVALIGNSYQAGNKKVIHLSIRELAERKFAETKIRRLDAKTDQRIPPTVQQQTVKKGSKPFGYFVPKDLRAPLRQVGSFVKELQKSAAPSLTPKNRRHLAMISESAKLMGELVNNLLASSELENSEINLDELIRDTVGKFQVETKKNHLVFKLSVLPTARTSRNLLKAKACVQRKQAELKRKEYSRKLQEISRRLVTAQETERRNIARELHDEIGQALTVVQLNLQAMLQFPGADALKPRLNESLRVVEHVLEQVHDISLDLRPAMLDHHGLVQALVWLTDRQAALLDLKVEFHADPLARRLDPVIETECFRIAQEALTNVVRHAHARAVTVNLRTLDGQLHLRVHDDGAGFDVASFRDKAARGASLGLLNMEERATLAGGGLQFTSNPKQGTKVHAWFPLRWAKSFIKTAAL